MFVRSIFHVWSLVVCVHLCIVKGHEDRHKLFHHRLIKSNATYCEDRTKLLPACTECIPGLQKGNFSSCDELLPETVKFRAYLKNITDHRYAPVPGRPYGLYPYLEKPDFLSRQVIFGKMVSSDIRNVLDIGAYYNPINLFLSHEACLENIVIVEPILDALSVQIPCNTDPSKKTHIMYLPITLKQYWNVASALPKPDGVVCVGCDALLGASRTMLETKFERPFTLFLEYPSEYRPSGPFIQMNGTGPGEDMVYLRKFQPKTNDTLFSKRVMKVIQYTKVIEANATTVAHVSSSTPVPTVLPALSVTTNVSTVTNALNVSQV